MKMIVVVHGQTFTSPESDKVTAEEGSLALYEALNKGKTGPLQMELDDGSYLVLPAGTADQVTTRFVD